jgi:hypothetical protein
MKIKEMFFFLKYKNYGFFQNLFLKFILDTNLYLYFYFLKQITVFSFHISLLPYPPTECNLG